MKKTHKILGFTLTELLLGAAAIVLGLVLLIWPNMAVSVILNGIGIICIIIGAVNAIRYFLLDARQSIASNELAIGLSWAAAGALVIALKPLLISILPFFFGLIVLIGGLVKVQGTLGFKRMNSARWYLELIFAIVSIALGLLILLNPFNTAMVLMRFIGGALVIEAIADLISRRAFIRTKEKFFVEFKN